MIAGVVLAAGESARFGGPKALAELGGASFAARSVDALRAAGCEPVIVVVGPPHEAQVAAAVAGCSIARNPSPERGMLSSLQAGLREVTRVAPAADAVLFSLLDHPRVRVETIAHLIAERARAECGALRPRVGGRGGHPVLLSRSAVAGLLAAASTASIRDVLAAGGGIFDLAVEDDGVLDDIDTPTDLSALSAGVGGKT